MAVLITGGYGNIGSWMAYHFASRGRQVYIYDCNPVYPECFSEVKYHIHFVYGDIMYFPHLVEVLRKHKSRVEGIVHTVGIMGDFVVENPHKFV